ncbi:Cloroperoxidase [Tricholoma matsutake]|nr:Cloroperoxidase [Tricholoma matsutake 945]
MSSITTFIIENITRLVVLVWDISLTIINILSPSLRVGHVIPKDRPGANGKWPSFIAPGEGDSRSACPAINAMANHGILRRDGRNISFKELNSASRATFNFAPTFCFVVPNFSAKTLKKSYWSDTTDLADINIHNGIEHDASLTRSDTAIESDQSKPRSDLVQELLSSATGKDKDGTPKLTFEDLSRFIAKRRADSKASNPEYTASLLHSAAGSTKCVHPIGF